MKETIYVATKSGLVISQRIQDIWRVGNRVLKDVNVTSIAAAKEILLAGTTRGIQRSDDNGQSWQVVKDGLSIPHVRWINFHPSISGLAFAGTEPAGIFVSTDAGRNWSTRPEVSALRDKHRWMLPYSPEAGCVRGFAFHGERIFAAVEVGGILVSHNAGATWALVAGSDGHPDLGSPPDGMIYPDVHDLAVHPSDPNLLSAATGGGFYRSRDGGASWTLLYPCYCRALWLDPNDPQHILLGPADQVGAVGRIEITRDGGKTWQPASGRLPVPWPRTMPERISQAGDELFAVLADGRLVSAPLATLDWAFVLGESRGVNAIAAEQ
ncbi:MAG: sialidase family protein [Thermoflexales bacterium]